MTLPITQWNPLIGSDGQFVWPADFAPLDYNVAEPPADIQAFQKFSDTVLTACGNESEILFPTLLPSEFLIDAEQLGHQFELPFFKGLDSSDFNFNEKLEQLAPYGIFSSFNVFDEGEEETYFGGWNFDLSRFEMFVKLQWLLGDLDENDEWCLATFETVNQYVNDHNIQPVPFIAEGHIEYDVINSWLKKSDDVDEALDSNKFAFTLFVHPSMFIQSNETGFEPHQYVPVPFNPACLDGFNLTDESHEKIDEVERSTGGNSISNITIQACFEAVISLNREKQARVEQKGFAELHVDVEGYSSPPNTPHHGLGINIRKISAMLEQAQIRVQKLQFTTQPNRPNTNARARSWFLPLLALGFITGTAYIWLPKTIALFAKPPVWLSSPIFVGAVAVIGCVFMAMAIYSSWVHNTNIVSAVSSEKPKDNEKLRQQSLATIGVALKILNGHALGPKEHAFVNQVCERGSKLTPESL